ncbi:MAG: aldo/keto reductase [Parasphingorhabdus sp.]
MIDRRVFVAGASLSGFFLSSNSLNSSKPLLLRTVPSSGENIPAIGMGSWLTFDVGNDPEALIVRTEILRTFLQCGGRLIDSSPMYGTSQSVIGTALAKLNNTKSVFAADKVWTSGKEQGLRQIRESVAKWRFPKMDLLQIHNLVDWETQLETLFEMKEVGRLRYVGITSYDGLRYDQLEHIMTRHPIDFVQFSYNIADRRAEERLFPIAKERGISVIINRPFQEGRLTRNVVERSLPSSAKEIKSESWAQYLLQWIVSNPTVTATIPATSRVDHMRENIGVLHKPIPDANLRERMARDFMA